MRGAAWRGPCLVLLAMSIVGDLLQRWRLRTDSRAMPAPGVAPTGEPAADAANTPPADAAPVVEGATDEICRLCGGPLRDDDVVAVHAADVVHSDCYDESLTHTRR